jgi:uncharacterized protein YndB with AHSA1/START domain
MTTANQAATTTYTTPSDREVAFRRVVSGPRKLVFEAWTSPQHLPRWMIGMEGWTMPVCEIDLRPGGAYRFVWRRANGTEVEIRGIYKQIAPPQLLVSTENWGGDWPETLNTVTLAEENNKTTVTVTVLYPSKEARDAALKTGGVDGMTEVFNRLEEYLRTLA